MFIMTSYGTLINLDNVQSITFDRAYTQKNRQGRIMESWEKGDGYEVVALTDENRHVIREVKDIPEALRIIDQLARDITTIGNEKIIIVPDDVS